MNCCGCRAVRYVHLVVASTTPLYSGAAMKHCHAASVSPDRGTTPTSASADTPRMAAYA